MSPPSLPWRLSETSSPLKLQSVSLGRPKIQYQVMLEFDDFPMPLQDDDSWTPLVTRDDCNLRSVASTTKMYAQRFMKVPG